MVVPTGVENRVLPTILIETIGITGGAVFLFLRRKRKETASQNLGMAVPVHEMPEINSNGTEVNT